MSRLDLRDLPAIIDPRILGGSVLKKASTPSEGVPSTGGAGRSVPTFAERLARARAKLFHISFCAGT